VLLALLALAGGTAHADYLLGPQDKVRIKAYEWRASRDEIFEWSALNDEFTVGAAGTLSLPFVGEIRAAGIATGELAATIADRLRSEMGLGRRPDTSVEIVQFRPFYIVGQVEHPGEFPYRPGLTVLQALSISGGLQKMNDGVARIERDAISARGDLQVLEMQAGNLRARRARLMAEMKESETIEFPRELTARPNDPSAALAMQQEQAIFQARRDALTTQMRALEQLKEFLEKEVVSLAAQKQTEETQIQLVKKELSGVSVLVDKGLAAAPRQFALERTVAQIEGERLRIETSLLRARQEISKTDIAILELKNKRANDVAIELRETQAKLEELDRKADTTEQLVYEAEVTAPQFLAARARSYKVQPVYTIVRQSAGKSVELAASESTTIEPGDTVKVEVPLPERARAADASAGPRANPAVIVPAARTETR